MPKDKLVIYDKVNSKGVCVTRIFLPTSSKILDFENYKVLEKLYCITGAKEFLKLTDEALPPGDYTFQFHLELEEKSELPLLVIEYEEISNLLLFQSLSFLYTCVGYEISQVLGFPSKCTLSDLTPICKRVKKDILDTKDTLVATINKLQESSKTSSIESGIESMIRVLEEMKRSLKEVEGIKRVSIAELEKLIEEKTLFYTKLKEAEDHIEYLINRIPRGKF